ncbi:MAG: pyruvate ferredoxin oxidoreductase subunit gamma [Chloroflexota bacterium]|nr:pyruvate ferredoxin oxidoreductase subunit gamma [Chloroflexota bacterium]
MIEIRFHGRGGQGAVVASEVLAAAFFREGRYVQAFPTFGVERRGAPVMAFTRVDDKHIRIRCQIYEPDHIVILDPTLLKAVDVTAGLKEGGWIVINSDRNPSAFDLPKKFKVATVDANPIAIKYHLGPKSAPIVNTAILGAFAKAAGVVSLDALTEAVRELAPRNPEGNVAATKEAYSKVKF